MAIDAFLELIGPGGQPISGESTDATFKKKISLRSITLASQGASAKEKQDTTSTTPQNSSTKSAPTTRSSQTSRPGPTTRTTSATQAATSPEKKRRFQLSLSFTKDVDSSSPELFQEYCRKAEIKDALKFDKAKISLRKSQGQVEFVFLVLEFTDLFVAKYSVEASDGKLPVETVALNFNSCTIEYIPQKATGTSTSRPTIVGWDFDKNKSKNR